MKLVLHNFKRLVTIAKARSRGYSSVGRAPALQAGCQRFESAYLHILFSLQLSVMTPTAYMF